MEKEEAATVANSKIVNNDWTTNKGCQFFLLDSAASVEKGKKQNKRRNKAVEKNKLLQWGYPVLRVQARNKAKGNHRLRLADPNSYTRVSRWIILITGC